MQTHEERIEIAAHAYLWAYGAHPEATDLDRKWGVKASSEDALVSVLRALFPDEYPPGRVGFSRVRNDPQMQGLAQRLWEEWECEGMNEHEIAAHLVPAIDNLRGGGPDTYRGVATCPCCGAVRDVHEKFAQATRTEPMRSLGNYGYCPSCAVSFAAKTVQQVFAD